MAIPASEEARRPTAILFVYAWDMLRAIAVLLVAFAAFGGGVEVSGKVVALPLAVQIFAALSAASLGTALLLIAILLTRHNAWIRRAQIVASLMAISLAISSYVVDQITAHTGIDLGSLVVGLALCALDIVVIIIMLTPNVAQWYSASGRIPKYISVLIAFWAATSAAFITARLTL